MYSSHSPHRAIRIKKADDSAPLHSEKALSFQLLPRRARLSPMAVEYITRATRSAVKSVAPWTCESTLTNNVYIRV